MIFIEHKTRSDTNFCWLCQKLLQASVCHCDIPNVLVRDTVLDSGNNASKLKAVPV